MKGGLWVDERVLQTMQTMVFRKRCSVLTMSKLKVPIFAGLRFVCKLLVLTTMSIQTKRAEIDVGERVSVRNLMQLVQFSTTWCHRRSRSVVVAYFRISLDNMRKEYESKEGDAKEKKFPGRVKTAEKRQ